MELFYCGAVVKLAAITDGLSKTYLVGERYINPDDYSNWIGSWRRLVDVDWLSG